MGAGITMAQGINRVEGETLNFAFIGDSTFFHTGIPGLINGVYNRGEFILVVLDNGTTAMTGNQVHPGMGRTVTGEPTEKLSIPGILGALGVKEVLRANPFDFAGAKRAVASLIPRRGVRALVFEGPCIALERGEGRCEVVPEKCTRCGACVKKTGCPALSFVPNERALSSAGTAELKAGKGGAAIDPGLCTGCELCRAFCAFGAITEKTGGPGKGAP
jgi:indolepyruvate ferredoxin oxidoreductase alpha subunit